MTANFRHSHTGGSPATLITECLDIWTSADTAKKSGRGRASGNATNVYGIKKLRELILELAVRGKLVPQNLKDEPASVLLKNVHAEKVELIKSGKIKKNSPLPPIIENEKSFELPTGWEWVRFGSVAQHNSGKTLDKGRNTGTLRAYITTSNLYWGFFELSNVRQMPMREDEIEKCTARKGDLLICEGGESGRAAVWPTNDEICFQNHIHRARFHSEINPYYVYRFFEKLNATGEINQHRKGVGISNMSSKALSLIAFPLPPLREQHRIVAKVDELMALCDQLEAQHNNAAESHEKIVSVLLETLTQSTDANAFTENWQRIATLFDTLFTTESSIDALKQTLLQLAVMGKLVPQDPKDEPSSKLLEKIEIEKSKLIAAGKIKKDKPAAIIRDSEKPFTLPKNWTWTRLETVLLKITDGTHHSPPNMDNGAFKYISAKNIKRWGIDLTDITYVTKEAHNEIYGRCDPIYGDILYIKDGATTGIATINTLREPFSMLSSVALLRPSIGINNQYLLKSMTAPFFYAEMRSEMTGVAITRVTLSKLNNAIIPLPPISEQNRIVAKIDELMALCEQLKSRITAANQCQQKLADVMIEKALA